MLGLSACCQALSAKCKVADVTVRPMNPRSFPIAVVAASTLVFLAMPGIGAGEAPVALEYVLEQQEAREAVKAFVDQGNRAEMHEYPGVRHAIPNRMREDVWTAILSELANSPAGDK